MSATLIHNSCLALSVLMHNDGSKNLRVLDVTEGCITPAIVMLDAHKHLGADNSISIAMGTLGTLSHLSGHRRLNGQPPKSELIRDVADLTLIGVEGYHEKYSKLAAAVVETTKMIDMCGMSIVHSHNRVEGSTVFGVEGPWGAVDDCLQDIKEGQSALEVFTSDLVESSKVVRKDPWDWIIALWFAGRENFWLLPFLNGCGICRNMATLLVRRIFISSLDCGDACSNKHTAPHKESLKHCVRSCTFAVLILGMLYVRRRQRFGRLRP